MSRCRRFEIGGVEKTEKGDQLIRLQLKQGEEGDDGTREGG